jgi:hypothetical protein
VIGWYEYRTPSPAGLDAQRGCCPQGRNRRRCPIDIMAHATANVRCERSIQRDAAFNATRRHASAVCSARVRFWKQSAPKRLRARVGRRSLTPGLIVQIVAAPSELASVRPQSPSHASSRSFCTACGSTKLSSQRGDRNRPRPLARLIPPGSPHRSMSASMTRPVRHNVPSRLSIVARPHEDGLMRSWRADSLCLRMARSRNYAMLQNDFAHLGVQD